jgi:hypothetical protein
MRVTEPTHVVTLSVWDTHRAVAVVTQYWVSAGPFDDAEQLNDHLAVSLTEASDAVECVDRRVSTHHGRSARWEQLSLL